MNRWESEAYGGKSRSQRKEPQPKKIDIVGDSDENDERRSTTQPVRAAAG